jgi:hypothetical protein
VARHIRGREEPREPGERDSRCHRRRSDPRFIRTVPRFGYAFRETVHSTDTGRPEGRSGVSFRITWVAGRVTLYEGEHVIGRDPNVEIYLDAPEVSRRHAQIKIAAARATIEDLGSKNGTFVGDQRVDGSRSVGDGDVITVGSVKLKVRALQAPTSTETQPDGRRVTD